MPSQHSRELEDIRQFVEARQVSGHTIAVTGWENADDGFHDGEDFDPNDDWNEDDDW